MSPDTVASGEALPEMAVEMTKTFLATEWCQDLEDWRKENMKKFAVQVSAIEDEIYGK